MNYALLFTAFLAFNLGLVFAISLATSLAHIGALSMMVTGFLCATYAAIDRS